MRKNLDGTLLDRGSGYIVEGLATSRTMRDAADVEMAALSGLPTRTVTPDRGKEFADWAHVT